MNSNTTFWKQHHGGCTNDNIITPSGNWFSKKVNVISVAGLEPNISFLFACCLAF
jgi:hypothetical protein